METFQVTKCSIDETVLSLIDYVKKFSAIKVYLSETTFFPAVTSDINFLNYTSEFCMGRCHKDYGAFKKVIPDVVRQHSLVDVYLFTCEYMETNIYIAITFTWESSDEEYSAQKILSCGAQLSKFDFFLTPQKIPNLTGKLTKGTR